MHTAIHPLVEVRSGEIFTLVFNITDAAGQAVDLTDAAAEYRIARRAGECALVTLESSPAGGIIFTESAAHVGIDTAQLQSGSAPLLGDFFGQLRLTIGGQTLVAAEGPFCIHPVILPAEETV